ncbi:MAG: Gfo/Idh/MocA family oxidoreductase [Planctomycetota bacterium]
MAAGADEPSSGAPLRLGVVGLGRIAQDYLRALRDVEALELVAAADVDPVAREAAELEVPRFESAAQMLESVSLEAALVLTPPATHESVCFELVNRGIHVLCEKPLSTSAASAHRMLQSASRAKVLLMMASKFRYVPDIVEAHRLINEGELGDLVLYDNAFCSRVDMTERWNAQHPVSGGGVMIDNGSHAVDVARYLLGPASRVLAHFGRRTQPVRVEDTVRILFESVSATIGVLDLSWTVDKGADYYLNVQGSRGTLQVGWQGSRYRLGEDEEWRPFGTGYNKIEAFRRQLGNFAAAIRGEDRPQVTSQDALESVRVVEAAYRSARIGRWIPVHTYDGAP